MTAGEKCIALEHLLQSRVPPTVTPAIPANPRSVHELMEHLKLRSGQIPEAFQLVLRVTAESQVPVRIRYGHPSHRFRPGIPGQAHRCR